jgi:polyhydroxybutyrate depolymerase
VVSVVRRSGFGLVAILAACLTSSCGASSKALPNSEPAVTATAPSGIAGYQSGTQRISIDVDGTTRSAVLVVPEDLSEPAPLLFAFHGHGGTGGALDRQLGFENLWPEAIVVYPDGQTGHPGINDPQGTETGWQTTKGEGGDADIAFYDALLADLQAKLPVDPDRIYLMGHSNGSELVSLLRNERGDAVAATANSSAQLTRWIPTDPVRSMFMSMGQTDTTAPYAQQKKAIPVAATHLGVDAVTARTDGYLTTRTGPDGIELAVYDHPGGHPPPPELPALLVAFFQRHTRPGN